MKHTFSTFFLSLVAVFALVGCGPQVQTGAEAGINIKLEAMGDAQAVGETMLMVTVTDDSGEPVNDATLNVQGDMTHAGMVPVIRDVEGGEDGVYTVPFEWTMGGDWIVTVLAILADGTEVEETFDLSVASDGEMAMDGEGHEGHNDGEMAMDDDKDAEGHEGHDADAEGDGHEGHGEDDKDTEGHEGHGDGEMAMDDDKDAEGHEGHSDGEMAMEMDAELITAVEALDVTSIHDIDVSVNEDGTIDAGYAATVSDFAMAFTMVSWPEKFAEDVEGASSALMSLKDALEAEDVEAAKPLATEAHAMVHDLVNTILEPGEEHDHGN